MDQVIRNYKDNEDLRASFNQLSKEIFGLTFESWYQNGFWNDKYIPYSIAENGKVIANVSVNIMDMCWNGENKHFLQLGTVMTAKAYRNRGLIRHIMKIIVTDYKNKNDGLFLFANDSVIDFYPKFGFTKAKEYQYSKTVEIQQKATFKSIPMKNKDDWNTMENAIKTNQFHGKFDMTNNSDLIMFYISQFMQNNVYYDVWSDTYVVAEVEDECVFIHAVFSKQSIDLEEIIVAFGNKIKKVVLGFVPVKTDGYQCIELKKEDTTLFMKGIEFKKEKLMYPTLSHA